MRRVSLMSAVAMLAVSGMAFGQAPMTMPMGQAPAGSAPTATGPAAEVQRAYAGQMNNILKAAEKMPADQYQYKPTPEVRTFARVVDEFHPDVVLGSWAYPDGWAAVALGHGFGLPVVEARGP